MARMNISVPDDVKARMDAVEEAVSWSAVASRAFEIELGEIAKRKQVKDMSDVIARLRASKLESDTEEYQNGHEDGKEWAEQYAAFSELRRLSKAEERRQDWDWDGHSIPQVAGGDAYDAEFWEGYEGIDNFGEDYFNGFVAGALEVFDQVADAI